MQWIKAVVVVYAHPRYGKELIGNDKLNLELDSIDDGLVGRLDLEIVGVFCHNQALEILVRIVMVLAATILKGQDVRAGWNTSQVSVEWRWK